MSEEEFYEIYNILPAHRLRFSNSEVWLDKYQPNNEAWCPIKCWDYHTIKDDHIRQLGNALGTLLNRVHKTREESKPKRSDEDWDKEVPDGVWVWLREKHPEAGIKTHSDLDAYLNDPSNKEGTGRIFRRICPVCRGLTRSGNTLCDGHHRAVHRWENQREKERLEESQ